MLAGDTGLAVADLARAMLSLRPFTEAGQPLPAPRPAAAGPVPGCLDPAEVAREVAGRLGLPVAAADAGAGPFDGLAAGRLDQLLAVPALAKVPVAAREELGRIADAAVAEGFDGLRAADVGTADGATLRTFTAGSPGRPAIVLASACGMPAQLCETWMRFLAADYFVVTWETRGLFGDDGPPAAFDGLSCDVAAQGADLLAVMDHHGLDSAHVMGLCGGAVLAVQAAALAPERIDSLSLWHGDFSGSAGPTTGHQDNLKALMAMAAGSRSDAAAINGALRSTAMAAVPPGVAHLVVYPYLADELFYRYCRLTGAIMAQDAAGLLAAVSRPTLVVTSEDDTTAHPGGSHLAAAALARGVLRVEPHGDHISVFSAGERLRRLLAGFLADPSCPPSV